MTAIFNIATMKKWDWYVAKCIDNNITSQGRIMEEAIANIKEALELYYEDDPTETTVDYADTFLSTLKIDFPWRKNTQHYQENKLWVVC